MIVLFPRNTDARLRNFPIFATVLAIMITGLSIERASASSSTVDTESVSAEFLESVRSAEFDANAHGLFDGALLFGLKADASAMFLSLKGKIVAAYDLRTHKIDLYTAMGVGLVAPLNLKEVLKTVQILGVYSSINVGVSLGYAGGSAYERGSLAGDFSGARAGYARGWGGDFSYYQSQIQGSRVWFALASVEFGIDSNAELTSLSLQHVYSER